MAFQPVPDTAEARITFSQTNNPRPIINLLYFLRATGWTQSTIQTLADELHTRFITALLPAEVDNGANLNSIHTRDLSTEFGVQATAAGAPIVGTATGPMSSPNNAILVRFIPTTPPPRLGGIFWPFVDEANISEIGEIDAGYRANLAGKINSWVSGVEIAAGCEHSIVSRYSNKVLRPSGVSKAVASYVARRRVASQRNRRATFSSL